MDEKELAEYVIKRILAGDVFFAGNPAVISFLEKKIPLKFENTGRKVKLRGYKDLYELYFIKKDEKFQSYSLVMVKGAGGNFETLLGFVLEDVSRAVHVHVYYIGSRFDLDKMSEMAYSLFTEIGIDRIKKTQEAIII
jgi:hypothetical protein